MDALLCLLPAVLPAQAHRIRHSQQHSLFEKAGTRVERVIFIYKQDIRLPAVPPYNRATHYPRDKSEFLHGIHINRRNFMFINVN